MPQKHADGNTMLRVMAHNLSPQRKPFYHSNVRRTP
jgi:hypothetical protein